MSHDSLAGTALRIEAARASYFRRSIRNQEAVEAGRDACGKQEHHRRAEPRGRWHGPWRARAAPTRQDRVLSIGAAIKLKKDTERKEERGITDTRTHTRYARKRPRFEKKKYLTGREEASNNGAGNDSSLFFFRRTLAACNSLKTRRVLSNSHDVETKRNYKERVWFWKAREREYDGKRERERVSERVWKFRDRGKKRRWRDWVNGKESYSRLGGRRERGGWERKGERERKERNEWQFLNKGN